MRTALYLALCCGCLACNERITQKPVFEAAACTQDSECAKDCICKDGHCQPGERTLEEKRAMYAKEHEEREAKKKAAEAKKNELKPGEGRLTVRICPGFYNNDKSIASLTAIHQTTGERYYLNLAREIPEDAFADLFTFPSLPLGKYDVTAKYGVIHGGVADNITLDCYKDVIKQCKNKQIREMEVVLPENVPQPKKDKDGNPIRQACDFWME